MAAAQSGARCNRSAQSYRRLLRRSQCAARGRGAPALPVALRRSDRPGQPQPVQGASARCQPARPPERAQHRLGAYRPGPLQAAQRQPRPRGRRSVAAPDEPPPDPGGAGGRLHRTALGRRIRHHPRRLRQPFQPGAGGQSAAGQVARADDRRWPRAGDQRLAGYQSAAGLRPRDQRADQPGQHGRATRQAPGRQHLPVLHRQPAGLHPGASAAGEPAAQGHRRRSAGSVLPAQAEPCRRPAQRGRSAGALAPSAAGHGGAWRLHRLGRRDRADRADWRVRAASGLPPGAPVAGGGAGADTGVGEYLGVSVAPGQPHQPGPPGARRNRPGAAVPGAGTDRKPTAGQRRQRHRHLPSAA